MLTLPGGPVLSKLDPDAVGILFRNLIENALKHGAQDGLVGAVLKEDGSLCVDNDGPVLPVETMERLMQRFERGDAKIGACGLGLSIIKVIAERTGMTLKVISPRPIRHEGVEVQVKLPLS
ncbi:sensor histidine kinase [Rhizobium sp. SGZ-381]|uniref:sensor histidine kinase n=1 Tax=Rhizobium sp. SGZ-381 TaxID=3342800 RepID=UPI0036705988